MMGAIGHGHGASSIITHRCNGTKLGMDMGHRRSSHINIQSCDGAQLGMDITIYHAPIYNHVMGRNWVWAWGIAIYHTNVPSCDRGAIYKPVRPMPVYSVSTRPTVILKTLMKDKIICHTKKR
jgi:hypothetical protein